MTRVHNIERKNWYNTTLSLQELKELIDAAVAKVDDPVATKVVGLTHPHLPLEAAVLGINLRSNVLDQLQGEHFNRLSGDLTDIEIEESGEDVEAEMKQGDVVYLILGASADYGHPMDTIDLLASNLEEHKE